MAEICIELAEDQLEQLREVAKQFGLAPEEMARLGLVDLLVGSDESVKAQIEYVIQKNRDLYQRLAG